MLVQRLFALAAAALLVVPVAAATQVKESLEGPSAVSETPPQTVLDPEPLAITAFEVGEITAFSAVVTWTTDAPAASLVSYGATDGYGATVTHSSLTLTHEVVLTGLAGGTTCHFEITSDNGQGEVATSGDQTFTTPASRVMWREDGAVLVDGAPFYPIMQWLQCGWRIEAQQALGINTFMGQGCGESAQAYLDTCAANGVWGIVRYDASVKDHTSLMGWYWEDEPEMPRSGSEPLLYPDELLDVYEMIREEDAAHPFVVTFTSRFASRFAGYPWMGGDTEEYADYANATDMLGFDHYPIYGWCRPDWLAEISDFHDEFMVYAQGRPTFQWIEAVRTSGQWCELSERGEDDGPYANEIRNEVWQAVVHGAKAIGYFTHSWECPGYTQFCLSAEQEAELSRTNGQLTTLTPAILGEDASGLAQVVVEGGGRVDTMVTTHAGNLYLFAVNLERTAATVTFTVDGVSGGVVTVLDEGRTLAVDGESFEDTFEGLGVHIYRSSYTTNEIFSDGFESGTTSAWSAVQP